MGWEKLATVTYVDEQVDTADAISELSDVTIDSSAASELLFTTGADAWANKTLTEAGIHPLTTVGIADSNLVEIDDADAADNDFAKFTANGLEGRSYTEVIADLSLEAGVDIQAYDAQLTDLAGLAVTDSSFIVGNGSNFVLEDASTSRTSLGLGDSATGDVGSDVQAWSTRLDKFATGSTADGAMWIGTGTGEADWALESGDTLRTSMGLAIGTNVQAEDAVLTDLAALSAVADNEMIVGTAAGVYAHESGATLRTSIGLGTSDAASFTDLTLSGGDLTYTAALGIAAFEVTAGTGYAISLSAGNAKDGGGTDIGGGAVTISGGQSTGSGRGGSILFKVSTPGVSSTTQNALVTALTIADDKKATFAGTTEFTGAQTFTGAATFASTVTIAGDLDVNGTTTTIESTNTAIVDPAIVLNKTKDLDTFGSANSAIIFGDSTGVTSTGKIINDDTTGFKFTDGGGASSNIPSDSTLNSATAGTAYKDLYMKMPVLATVAATPTAVTGAIWFDGTDMWIGT
jgi:hypothetical protein